METGILGKSFDELHQIRLAQQWSRIEATAEHSLHLDRFVLDFRVLVENLNRLRQSGLFSTVENRLSQCILTWKTRETPIEGKRFVDPLELQTASLLLAHRVVESGFRPDFLVGIWRGGCSVALYIHEYLKLMGFAVDHIALRTSLYEGIDKPGETVRVHGEQYLVERLQPMSTVLFVDDILESGRSMAAIFATLRQKLSERAPPPENFRVATVFTKSAKHVEGNPSATFSVEDLSRDTWVVFPHELEGLTDDELRRVLPGATHAMALLDRSFRI